MTASIKCPTIRVRKRERNRGCRVSWRERTKGRGGNNWKHLFLSFSSKVNQIGLMLYEYCTPPPVTFTSSLPAPLLS